MMAASEMSYATPQRNGFAPDVAGRGFIGKFRAKVTDNMDPLGKARLRVTAADVLDGKDLGWALAAVPYGGDGVGFFFIPPKGADVWVEFEQGDPDYPIWTGCFWPETPLGGPSPPRPSGSPPGIPVPPSTKMLKTDYVTITITDAPGMGSLTIETKDGMKIVMKTLEGIEISNKAGIGASVKLTPKSVTINQGALEVT
jgi:uncharacterized protein involved in type VI secretion and phage assembly